MYEILSNYSLLNLLSPIVSILDDELQQSIRYYKKKLTDVLFQQDNDPKHKSKKAQKWLHGSELEVMEWPPQSPDLSLIEHLWHHFKNKFGEYDRPAFGIAELWERVQKEWNNIPASICQNLIGSMPRRVQAVL